MIIIQCQYDKQLPKESNEKSYKLNMERDDYYKTYRAQHKHFL